MRSTAVRSPLKRLRITATARPASLSAQAAEPARRQIELFLSGLTP